MKLVRFDGGKLGLLDGGNVHDITALAGVASKMWPPIEMLNLIRNFDALGAGLEAAKRSAGTPLADVRLEAPVVWPNKLLAYPVNYTAHGTEMKSKNRADLNGFFVKASSSLSGPADPILLPDLPGREIHHECEFAVIIGKTATDVSVDKAMDCIFGYSCLVDMTVRGNEERAMRKSYDSFTPIGPWIVTADEIPDPASLGMKLWVDDELRQSANTRDLIVDIPNMVALASSVLTLEPGDVIATGTPAGVGPVRAGNTVRIEIDKVGSMTLPVRMGNRGQNIVIHE